MKVANKILIIAVCCLSTNASATDKMSVSDLLDKYTRNRSELGSFIAKAECVHCVQWHYKEQPAFSRIISEFRFDAKRMHLLHYTWDGLATADANTPIEDARYWADLWDGEFSILYAKRMSADEGSAIISTEERLVKHNMVTWCGGMPLLGFRHSDYEPIDSVLRRADSISIRPELEQIGSAACHVVDANATSGAYTVWFDPQHGYQIARADIRVGPGDVFRPRPLENNQSDTLSVRGVRFENVEGTWVPMEADTYSTSIRQRQDRSCTSTSHFKITQITFNPDHETLGSFVPVVESGTEVDDRDSGARYTWQAGKKFLVDARDGSIKYVPKDWSILVRVGKPLPVLEGFTFNLAAEQTKDTPLLLCFFDMDQRPSRNCLRRLSARAQEFKARGVFIVAVHASKVGENKLDEWTNRNNISFPVGMIEDNNEKTRFGWGVRSLPWLILTDKQHVVTAEGFGMAELDQKLNDNSNR